MAFGVGGDADAFAQVQVGRQLQKVRHRFVRDLGHVLRFGARGQRGGREVGSLGKQGHGPKHGHGKEGSAISPHRISLKRVYIARTCPSGAAGERFMTAWHSIHCVTVPHPLIYTAPHRLGPARGGRVVPSTVPLARLSGRRSGSAASPGRCRPRSLSVALSLSPPVHADLRRNSARVPDADADRPGQVPAGARTAPGYGGLLRRGLRESRFVQLAVSKHGGIFALGVSARFRRSLLGAEGAPSTASSRTASCASRRPPVCESQDSRSGRHAAVVAISKSGGDTR